MCKRRIEKDAGCMHMTCSAPCGYEFCWQCLGPWTEHKGSFYKCDKYEEAKKEGAYDEEERERKEAIKSLGKYTHYYERWTSNHKSRQQAMEVVRELEEDERMNVLRKAGQTERDLKFITEAWIQIAECRRVLKWTCPYAYYLERPKRHLFKQLEGEADAVLERLRHCAEEDLGKHMTEETEKEEPKESFKDLGIRLKALTGGAKTFFLLGNLEH